MEPKIREIIGRKIARRAARQREKRAKCGICDVCGKHSTARGLTLYKNKFMCERCLLPNDQDLQLNPYSSETMTSLCQG